MVGVEGRDDSDTEMGKGILRERRDVTDSARGKGVVGERRNVSDSARENVSFGRDLMLQIV